MLQPLVDRRQVSVLCTQVEAATTHVSMRILLMSVRTVLFASSTAAYGLCLQLQHNKVGITITKAPP